MGLYLARPGLRKAAIAKQTPAQRKAANLLRAPPPEQFPSFEESGGRYISER